MQRPKVTRATYTSTSRRWRRSVYECRQCGRLWCFYRDSTGHLVNASNRDIDLINGRDPHTGPCNPADGSTWSAACSGFIYEVKLWPELEAAWRLGGPEAATLLYRPIHERGEGRHDHAAWLGEEEP